MSVSGGAVRAGIWTGSSAIALAYAAAFLPAPTRGLAPWLMAAGITVLVVSLLALGALRPDRRAPPLVWAALAVAGVALGGGFVLALGLGAERPDGALLLGLPRRAALVLYGVGLLPAVVVPAVYALTFDRAVLSGARLEQLRAELARVRPGGPGAPAPE